MANDEEDKGKRLLGYAFNYEAEVGPGERFVVTGSLPLDATLEDINKEFDKFYAAASRQKVKALRINLREGIAQAELQIKMYEDNLQILDERKGGKLAGNERTQRDQITTNLKHDREQLEHKKRVLAEIEKQLE